MQICGEKFAILQSDKPITWPATIPELMELPIAEGCCSFREDSPIWFVDDGILWAGGLDADGRLVRTALAGVRSLLP